MGKGTYSEEPVANVVRDVYREPHVCEMKPVAQPNQCQRDNMMPHQLPEIFPGLLEHQTQYQSLLGPVSCLQQIVGLEDRLVGAIGKGLVHARRVEIPDRRAVHHVQTEGTEDAKIDSGVRLFQKAVLL